MLKFCVFGWGKMHCNSHLIFSCTLSKHHFTNIFQTEKLFSPENLQEAMKIVGPMCFLLIPKSIKIDRKYLKIQPYCNHQKPQFKQIRSYHIDLIQFIYR